MNPPSRWPEGEAELEIGGTVRAFVKQNDLGRTFGSAQAFVLPDGSVVAPDLSFVSHARWRAGPAPVAGEPLRVVPDLVVEIASPASAARDRVVKGVLHAEAGVRESWIVDARRREATVHVAVGEGRFDVGRTIGEHEALASLVLPGFAPRLGDLLPRP